MYTPKRGLHPSLQHGAKELGTTGSRGQPLCTCRCPILGLHPDSGKELVGIGLRVIEDACIAVLPDPPCHEHDNDKVP
jgi:hypothetical protein